MFCSKEYLLLVFAVTLTVTSVIFHYGGDLFNQSKLDITESKIATNSTEVTLGKVNGENGIGDSQDQNIGVPLPLPPYAVDERKEVNNEDKSKDIVKVKEEPPATTSSKRPSLLQYLLDEYKTYEGNEQKQLEVLIKLEELSERYENAVNLFTRTNALDTVLLPALNSTSIDIRGATCSLFAVAGQNNPIVQSKAVKKGVLINLIKLMKYVPRLRPNALFAITSLLRNYPDAQKKFIMDDGVTELSKIAYLPETRRRILTFLTDLLNERSLCRAAAKVSPVRQSKASWDESIETESVDDPCDKDNLLISALEKNEWWKLLDYSLRYLGDYDLTGDIVIIDAIHASLSFCTPQLIHLIPELQKLVPIFENVSDFKETKTKLNEILRTFSSPPAGIESSSDVVMSSAFIILTSFIISLTMLWMI